jgi:hypothetical protein
LLRSLAASAVTIATTALATSTASAATLEIRNEAGNTHCPAVSISGTDVNGGCLIHATSEGEIEIRKHVFGIESHITTCGSEFWGRVDEDAVGYAFEEQLTQMPLSPSQLLTPGLWRSSRKYPLANICGQKKRYQRSADNPILHRALNQHKSRKL